MPTLAGGGNLLSRDGERLKRPGRRVAKTASMQDPHIAIAQSARELLEQRRLSDAGFSLDADDPTVPRAGGIQRGLKRRQLVFAANESRLRKRVAPIVCADRDLCRSVGVVDPAQDGFEIDAHSLRRLVSITRILSQQPIEDGFQGRRRFWNQGTQRRWPPAKL